MARTPKLYARLTRDAAGLGSYCSLWLGADHLMLVTSTGYSESYARVQLRDIKAFFVTPTDRRMWFGLGWGAIALFATIILLVALANEETPIFSVFFLLFGATGFIWNHVLGPGCRVFAVTGVQTARLRSLVREKKAHRVIAQLQPVIVTAQADLVVPIPPEAPPRIEPEPVPAAEPSAPVAETPSPAAPPPPETPPAAP